jgi:hypothetical protein
MIFPLDHLGRPAGGNLAARISRGHDVDRNSTSLEESKFNGSRRKRVTARSAI